MRKVTRQDKDRHAKRGYNDEPERNAMVQMMQNDDRCHDYICDYFSLDPIELKIMITALRNCIKSIGNPIKKIHDDEKELRIFAHRAIQSTKIIEIGEKFVLGKNVEILRPGNRKRGMDPRCLQKIINKKSRRRIKSGDGITLNDI